MANSLLLLSAVLLSYEANVTGIFMEHVLDICGGKSKRADRSGEGEHSRALSEAHIDGPLKAMTRTREMGAGGENMYFVSNAVL